MSSSVVLRGNPRRVSFFGFMKSFLKRPFTGVYLHIDIEMHENGNIDVYPMFAGKKHPKEKSNEDA